MSETLGDLAPHFFQAGYVVREVDAAEEWFQRVMGVPSFFRMENVPFGEGCSYRGRPADAVAHLSIGYLGETQIELIESVRGPSIYTEFLERKGPGLHHLAFAVPDFGASVAALREAGLELVSGGRMGGGTEFAYFDCEGPGFSVVEILGFDDGTRAFMEQLKAESVERG